MSGSPDGTGPHLVPPPPPRTELPKRRRQATRSSGRVWLWPLAFAAGIGLGIAGYQFAPDLDFYFDYWIALALS